MLASCSHKDSEPDSYEFLTAQRQKVANALSRGVNTDAAKPLIDSINAGVDTLWIDVSLDPQGDVAFVGYIALDEFWDRTQTLDGTEDLKTYSGHLGHLAECIDVGMYYNGNRTQSAASVGLIPKTYRDSFGDFYAYMPSLRFNNGFVISLAGFFKSDKFTPYRGELTTLMDFLGDD